MIYLEVPTNDEEVYARPASCLAGFFDGGVDGVQCAMATAFDGHTEALLIAHYD